MHWLVLYTRWLVGWFDGPCYKEGRYGLVVVGGGVRVPCHEHPPALHCRRAVPSHVGCTTAVASTAAIEQPAGATRARTFSVPAAVDAAWRLLVTLPLSPPDAIPARPPGCCKRGGQVLPAGLRRELELRKIGIREPRCRLHLVLIRDGHSTVRYSTTGTDIAAHVSIG